MYNFNQTHYIVMCLGSIVCGFYSHSLLFTSLFMCCSISLNIFAGKRTSSCLRRMFPNLVVSSCHLSLLISLPVVAEFDFGGNFRHGIFGRPRVFILKPVRCNIIKFRHRYTIRNLRRTLTIVIFIFLFVYSLLPVFSQIFYIYLKLDNINCKVFQVDNCELVQNNLKTPSC